MKFLPCVEHIAVRRADRLPTTRQQRLEQVECKLCGWWYNPDAWTPTPTEPELPEIELGSRWKLRSSGHVAEVVKVDGDNVEIDYAKNKGITISKKDLVKEATKI